MNIKISNVLSNIDRKNYPIRSDYRLRLLGELIALRLQKKRKDERRKALEEALRRVNLESKSVKGKPRYLKRWRETLNKGWPEVKRVLVGDDDLSVELRQSIPFFGIITEEERLSVLLRSYGKDESELPELKRKLAVAMARMK